MYQKQASLYTVLLAYLQEIANVDDKCSRRWLNVDPSVIAEDLEASNLVLQNYGQESRVRMPSRPKLPKHGDFMLGASRVVVAYYSLSLVALYVTQVARFEPKRLGEQLKQPVSQTLHMFGVFK